MEQYNIDELRELVEAKKYVELKTILAEQNEIDVALFLEELDPEPATVVFRILPKEMAAEVFAALSAPVQQHIVEAITDRELSAIIEDLYIDDAVDMLEELPANVVKRVLRNAKPDTRTLINQFLKYPDNSAGSIMTAEFVDLKKAMTVRDAFAYIRRTGIDKETVYTCYVIDASRRLEGVVSVKDLFLARDDQLIEEVMDRNVICASTLDDPEEVAHLFSKYGFLSLPVVDHEQRLVGIVTVDDAVEVIEQEATEDFEIMAALSPSETPYLKTSVLSLAKNRIVWLLVLMVSAMLTGGVLGKFEHAFAAMPLLVTFIPMLTDTGGNAGSQSSTLVIRGMAVGEIENRDFLRVLWKELRVSMLVGAILSLVNFVRLIITYPGNEMIALTVALSLFATVVIAKTIGGVLPMAAKFLKADPAIMAAPLITTIVDAVSLLVYFNIAMRLLNI
ncbi:magnesium transporter [Feifania hominis]|uniref:Magnesium transporter MgtE n=1 Tax=Feifania hominis TaxID=2763660 RepID=A0A926DCN4_9FIRM|nr:magnesium transporter [Feifania hominis]MBC8536530.1 magnesium transporter [Feifania hominis]